MMACFGMRVASDKNIRNRRFFEEATELVQACGMRREEAHELVDYVYNRPVGEIKQEIGGTMTTLAALCLAQDADMDEAADTELSRNWGNIEKIRAKQASKPFGSALPQAVAPEELSYQAKPRNTEEWWDIPEWLVTEYASRGYEVRTKHTRYTKA